MDIVYIRITSDGFVYDTNSSAFLMSTIGWVKIDEGEGDRYRLAQLMYFDKPLCDDSGAYNYVLEKGVVRETTAAEKNAQLLGGVIANKLAEINASCEQVIVAGVDVETTQGSEHFALTPSDQTNIMSLGVEAQAGASYVPYHADGKLCRMFTASEILAVVQSAKGWIVYHTTYCNHLRDYVKSLQNVEDVAVVYYGMPLPAELQSNFDAIVTAAGGSANVPTD